jgi:hypothetical protein
MLMQKKMAIASKDMIPGLPLGKDHAKMEA